MFAQETKTVCGGEMQREMAGDAAVAESQRASRVTSSQKFGFSTSGKSLFKQGNNNLICVCKRPF